MTASWAQEFSAGAPFREACPYINTSRIACFHLFKILLLDISYLNIIRDTGRIREICFYRSIWIKTQMILYLTTNCCYKLFLPKNESARLAARRVTSPKAHQLAEFHFCVTGYQCYSKPGFLPWDDLLRLEKDIVRRASHE